MFTLHLKSEAVEDMARHRVKEAMMLQNTAVARLRWQGMEIPVLGQTMLLVEEGDGPIQGILS